MSGILKYFHVKQKQSLTTRAENETNLLDPSGPLNKVILSSTILYTHDAHESSNLQQISPFRLLVVTHTLSALGDYVILKRHVQCHPLSLLLIYSPNFFCQNLYPSTFTKHYHRQTFPLYSI